MAVYKRGKKWWTTFYVADRRYRKPTGAATKNEAKRVEHDLIEAAKRGSLTAKQEKPTRLEPAIDAYLADKGLWRAPRTVELEKERLNIVKKHFGDVRLSAITADAIANYQRTHFRNLRCARIKMDEQWQYCGKHGARMSPDEKADNPGKGAILLDGHMVEKLDAEIAKRVLARAP